MAVNITEVRSILNSIYFDDRFQQMVETGGGLKDNWWAFLLMLANESRSNKSISEFLCGAYNGKLEKSEKVKKLKTELMDWLIRTPGRGMSGLRDGFNAFSKRAVREAEDPKETKAILEELKKILDASYKLLVE